MCPSRRSRGFFHRLNGGCFFQGHDSQRKAILFHQPATHRNKRHDSIQSTFWRKDITKTNNPRIPSKTFSPEPQSRAFIPRHVFPHLSVYPLKNAGRKGPFFSIPKKHVSFEFDQLLSHQTLKYMIFMIHDIYINTLLQQLEIQLKKKRENNLKKKKGKLLNLQQVTGISISWAWRKACSSGPAGRRK